MRKRGWILTTATERKLSSAGPALGDREENAPVPSEKPGRSRALVDARIKIMIPNGKSLQSRVDLEEPLENQPLEWAEEDREMEDRKPDLGEIEEDTPGV